MKKYATILADPPWLERGGGKIKRGADKHYPLMKTDQIAALPVADLVKENAHLYLWVTNGHLPDGLRVMDAWGFKYKTNIAWAKDRIGLGQYYRGQHELCLFGVRGNIPYRRLPSGKRAQGRTLITARRGAHSEKPEELRAMVEVVSPGPYIELFARQKYPEWDSWGLEVKSDVNMYTCVQCKRSWVGGMTNSMNMCESCYTAEPEKCAGYGCNKTATHCAFCESCWQDYKEDPDAFK